MGITVAFVVTTAAVLVSCGRSSGDDDATSSVPLQADRDAVIEAWGDAMVHGDALTMSELTEPSAKAAMSAEESAALESIEPPVGVEVMDFGFTVVNEEEMSVEVIYTGERCAPTVTKRFGPTTVAGGVDVPGGPDRSSVDEGVLEYGDVECIDLGATPGLGSPYRFVEVDGRWYWTASGP